VTAPADLDLIAREGRRIIELGRAAPDAIVPQYPTWTLRDLVVHVADIDARTRAVCESLVQERPPATPRPADLDDFAWATVELQGMLEVLRTADPEALVWTLIDDRRLGFWGRRMVIETGVHRWDAERAMGDPQPLDPAVAAHGLDEFHAFYLPRLGTVPALELRATDLGRAWRFGEGHPEASVEGTASNLFLRLMSRPGAALPPEWERAVDSLASPAEG
jgi:uncharacterized protein (TIGR03083 family)